MPETNIISFVNCDWEINKKVVGLPNSLLLLSFDFKTGDSKCPWSLLKLKQQARISRMDDIGRGTLDSKTDASFRIVLEAVIPLLFHKMLWNNRGSSEIIQMSGWQETLWNAKHSEMRDVGLGAGMFHNQDDSTMRGLLPTQIRSPWL